MVNALLLKVKVYYGDSFMTNLPEKQHQAYFCAESHFFALEAIATETAASKFAVTWLNYLNSI